ncbi:MAG: phosphoribosylaminoimidazolesuccinocarboxamide synthase [Pseudobdellovibrionaceae bacterium]
MTSLEMKKIYEGKSKIIYSSENDFEYFIQFKDDLTALNGKKKGSFEGKGKLSQKIATLIYSELSDQGIRHHLIDPSPAVTLNSAPGNEGSFWKVKKLEMVPLEVVVRNRAAGSLVKRLGLQEGHHLKKPLVEFYFKSDALQDPFVSDDQVLMLDLIDQKQILELKVEALKLNAALMQLFDRSQLILVDFKVEYGFSNLQQITLGDDLTPDCFRAWDKNTLEKYDKDRFRFDLGNVEQGYQKIYEQLIQGRKK